MRVFGRQLWKHEYDWIFFAFCVAYFAAAVVADLVVQPPASILDWIWIAGFVVALATSLYHLALNAGPKVAERVHRSSTRALEDGRYAEAARRLAICVRLCPHTGHYRYALGRALALSNRPREAIGEYSYYIKLQPRSWEGYAARAESFRLLGMESEAEEDADIAATLSGGQADRETH